MVVLTIDYCINCIITKGENKLKSIIETEKAFDIFGDLRLYSDLMVL